MRLVIPSLFLCTALAWAQSEGREKIAEGRYQELSNGILSKATQHSWVLWRTSNGLELEDSFANPDQNASRMFQAMAADNSFRLSPALRQEIQSSAMPDRLVLELNSTLQLNGMRLEGKQWDVNKVKTVSILQCANSAKETRCKGMKGNPKLKTEQAQEMFYSFEFPMLFSSLVRASKRTPQRPEKIHMAKISFDTHQRPQISEVDTEVEYMGQDDLQIVDKSFHTGKYSVRMTPKNQAATTYSVWASSEGLVLAVEAAKSPGIRMVLTDYQKHAEF